MPKVQVYEQSYGLDVRFYCPGCKSGHQVRVRTDGGHPSWAFNGDADRPTIDPSISVKSTQFTPKGQTDYDRWHAEGCPPHVGVDFDYVDTVCHSFIRDGRIQFLGDCAHALAGQTVDLPEAD